MRPALQRKLQPKILRNSRILIISKSLNGVQVGARARLRNCIVDKDVEIPAGERIGYDKEQDRARFVVSDKGIVVVPKGYRFN